MIPVKPGAGHFIQINRTNTSSDIRVAPCVEIILVLLANDTYKALGKTHYTNK